MKSKIPVLEYLLALEFGRSLDWGGLDPYGQWSYSTCPAEQQGTPGLLQDMCVNPVSQVNFINFLGALIRYEHLFYAFYERIE